MSRGKQDTFPLAPLLGGSTITEFAVIAGVDRATVRRWAVNGIPRLQADRIAIAIGRHPAEVWPDYHPRDAA